MELNDEQFHRYARHLILDEVGEEGQEKLLESRVLVVGAGGLGAPLLMYLAAAGVGTLGIVDDDAVDLTNLQRQIVHATGSVGRRKTESAKETIAALNPGIYVVTHDMRLDADNAAEIIAGVADFVTAHPEALRSHGVVVGATLDPGALTLGLDQNTTMPILAPGFGAQGIPLSRARTLFPRQRSVIAVAARSLLSTGPEGFALSIQDALQELAA